MFRRSYALVAFAVLTSVGCVPVTEPVGDVTKAEPDKALVGTWSTTKAKGLAAMLDIKKVVVDAPEVKGNPKGLMRMKLDENDEAHWFFLNTVGKHTYVSMILGDNGEKPPQFDKKGDYAKWMEREAKKFFVVQYARDGDTVVLDSGNLDAFVKLMEGEKIRGSGEKHIEFFATPAGWLDKYLTKTGPDKVFDGTNVMTLKRDKK